MECAEKWDVFAPIPSFPVLPAIEHFLGEEGERGGGGRATLKRVKFGILLITKSPVKADNLTLRSRGSSGDPASRGFLTSSSPLSKTSQPTARYGILLQDRQARQAPPPNPPSSPRTPLRKQCPPPRSPFSKAFLLHFLPRPPQSPPAATPSQPIAPPHTPPMFSSPFLLSLLLLLSPTPTLSSSLEWEVPTFTLLQPQHNTTVINLSELTIQWTVNSTLPPSTAVTVELWEARNIQNHPFLGPNKLTDDLVATIETGYKNCPGEETCIINWR